MKARKVNRRWSLVINNRIYSNKMLLIKRRANKECEY